MKKLLGAALALAVGVTCTASLAGCGGDKDNVDYTEVVNSAIDTVTSMYGKASEKETTSSFKVLAKTQYNGTPCNITWSVSSEVATYMSVGTTLDDDNKVTISVTRPSTDIEYTLTATAKAGGKTAKHDFARTLKGMGDVSTVAQIKALDVTKTVTVGKNNYYSEDGTTATEYTVKGYVVDTGSWSDTYNNFSNIYIVDEYSEDKTSSSSDALQLYALKPDGVYLTAGDTNALSKGDLITVHGCVQIYNGKVELTYCGSVDLTCIGLEPATDTRTDEEKAQAAIDAISFSAEVTSNLTLPTSTVKGVTLSFSSSNTSVISNTGVVTRPAVGAADATVTFTVTANSNGKTAKKDFTIVVKAMIDTSSGATVNLAMGDYASAHGWTNDTKYTTINVDDNITVTVSGVNSNPQYDSNSGKYYTSGTQWRVYQTENPSIVFTAASGYKIATIKITYVSEKTGVITNADKTTQYVSGAEITVDAATITLSVGNSGTATNGQARITAIEVVYVAA